MKRVITTSIPPQSALKERVKADDFADCYQVESEISARRAAEIIIDFPVWARTLMTLRNTLTSPFGLSAGATPAVEKLGIFPIEMEDANEIIAGFNDKHLNFRISVLSLEGKVFLSTWVHPHNWGGRMYLKTILPFHILISKNALVRVSTAL